VSKNSKLAKALKANPELRAKFLSNLAEAAQEAGLSVDDIRKDEALEFLGPLDLSDLEGGPQNIVIIHKSDSDKNETSIVVGGKGLAKVMNIAREIERTKK